MPTPKDKQRDAYYRERNEKIVSFVVEDPETKQRIKDAADKDGRSVNSWILHHILPRMLEEADRQLEPVKPRR